MTQQRPVREKDAWLGQRLQVKIDRPIGSYHPRHPNLKYELNYGFIPNTQAADGHEVDAYIIGKFEPLDSFEGDCIAIIHRIDDVEDKLVIAPPGQQVSDDEIWQQTAFQEGFFKSVLLIRKTAPASQIQMRFFFSKPKNGIFCGCANQFTQLITPACQTMTCDMNHNITFRHATESDADALLDLYQFLSPDGDRCPPELARHNIKKLAQIEGSALFVGEVSGEMVTSCTLIVVPNLTRGGRPYALIENVVTHPEHRGKGLGKAVLDAACDRAWEQGCYKVMLSTGSAKPSTLSFYESAGFEQSRTGFQKRRVPKRAETAD